MSGLRLSLGPEHLEAVLEAGCATLPSSQLRHASAAGEVHRTALAREIRSVRSVMTALRVLRSDPANPLLAGFVFAHSPPAPRRASPPPRDRREVIGN